MNGRQPTFDITHMRNHRYDPASFKWEQAWTCEVIEAWLPSREDTTVTAMATAITGAGVPFNGGVGNGSHLLRAETIREKSLEHSQTDVPKGDIEASIRNWRREQDLALRLNCPYCQKNPQRYMNFCRLSTESPRW